MKILIDICHPAHAHFFRHPIKQLEAKGHEVTISTREKDCVIELLDQFKLPYEVIHFPRKNGLLGMGRELIQRDRALARFVKAKEPDVLTGIAGTFIAHAGMMTHKPSLVFYDSDNAKLQNLITYPFATHIHVPDCYRGWLPKKRHSRYKGFHEQSYLRPDYFTPDKKIAVECGLDPAQRNFFIRIVSGSASHDIGHHGLSAELQRRMIDALKPHGNVIISCETDAPEFMQPYLYQGKTEYLHHVLAFCDLYLGESATMASEAAHLGTPACYVSTIECSTINQLSHQFGLCHHLNSPEFHELLASIKFFLRHDKPHWLAKRDVLLEQTIDVAAYVTKTLDDYPIT